MHGITIDDASRNRIIEDKLARSQLNFQKFEHCLCIPQSASRGILLGRMTATGKKHKSKVGNRALVLPLRLAAVLTFSFFLFPFALSSRAHEPITTKVRFDKEVIRVFQRSCLGCHHTGSIAMSLATYEEARPWAKAIKEEVLEKRMPPWRAVKGYGEFRNAPALAQHDVDLLVNWVEGGAPKGDDKDLPPGPLFSIDWQLGKPDLILKPEGEFKIAADADEYRTFMLSPGVREDRWLSAVDLQPGNASVVHCATIYLLKDEASSRPDAPMMQIKKEESEAATPPADLRSATPLSNWMPGQKTVVMGDGVARLLPAGSRIAVRIHYHGSGEATTDLSTVGLYFAKTARKQVNELAFSSPEIIIPVSAEPYRIKLTLTTESNAEAIAIHPTVHPLIVSLQATAYRPDGSQEVLIWTRGYQFDWEPAYYFKRPVSLSKDTRVDVIAYFDNSDENQRNPNNPPKPLRWSELTAEPLCRLLIAPSDGSAGSVRR